MVDKKIVKTIDADLQRRQKTQRFIRRGRGGVAKKLEEDSQWKFWHNLALSLRIPVEELKDRMTAREYQSWKRYKMIAGPFGPERADYNTALIVKTLHEITNAIIAVNTGKTEELPKLEDCLLKFKYVLNELNENKEAENVKRFLRSFR